MTDTTIEMKDMKSNDPSQDKFQKMAIWKANEC